MHHTTRNYKWGDKAKAFSHLLSGTGLSKWKQPFLGVNRHQHLSSKWFYLIRKLPQNKSKVAQMPQANISTKTTGYHCPPRNYKIDWNSYGKRRSFSIYHISTLISRSWKVVPGTNTRLSRKSPRRYAPINAARTQGPRPKHGPFMSISCQIWVDQRWVLPKPFNQEKRGYQSLFGWLQAIYHIFFRHKVC